MLMRFIAFGALLALAACIPTGARAPGWAMFTSTPEPERRDGAGPLVAVDGVPPAALEACRATIADRASSRGAVRVEAVSAGTLVRLPNGLTEAPIEARITYEQGSQFDVRQARVTCRLDDQGGVAELL
jgi:hypothetical protein